MPSAKFLPSFHANLKQKKALRNKNQPCWREESAEPLSSKPARLTLGTFRSISFTRTSSAPRSSPSSASSSLKRGISRAQLGSIRRSRTRRCKLSLVLRFRWCFFFFLRVRQPSDADFLVFLSCSAKNAPINETRRRPYSATRAGWYWLVRTYESGLPTYVQMFRRRRRGEQLM